MDISDTIIPNSAQINAEDLIHPITVQITGVDRGNAEQPVFIHLAEFPGRTYRPGKSMRRVLVAAWSAEASSYVGKQMTLFNDPTIRFGREVTGGIRISHMSGLTKPLSIVLTVTRGKRAPFVVQPLGDAPAPVETTLAPIAEHLDAINNAATIEDLQHAWGMAQKAGVTNDSEVVSAKDRMKERLS